MELHFGDPRQGACDYVFNTGLGGCGHGDGVLPGAAPEPNRTTARAYSTGFQSPRRAARELHRNELVLLR